MKGKQIFRTVAFLLLVCVLLVFLCTLFKFQNSQQSMRMRTYKDQQRGAVDAVYLGASSVDRFWVTSKAYEDYGMTVYPLSTDGFPTWTFLPLLKEALRTQDPELIIIDVRGFGKNPVSRKEQVVRSRTFFSELPLFSPNHWSAVDRSLEHLEEEFPEETDRYDLSYYLSFIRYHDKWSTEDFSFTELQDPPSEYLGTYVSKNSVLRKTWTPREEMTEPYPLVPYNERYLRELLDYVKAKDLNVLFVNTPHWHTLEESGCYLTVENIISEYGYPCAFYQTQEKMREYDFNLDTDFYEGAHMNFYGACKFTDVFAAYLHEHYDFPDHRNDPKCQSWNGVFDHLKKKIRSLEKEYGAQADEIEVEVGKTD